MTREIMTQKITRIPISSIILDEDIYPRKGIDHRRVGIFAENIRDGFRLDPIEVELVPDKADIFRMNRLGIPQDRMAKRLGLDQKTIHYHLGKMPVLANSLNGDLRVTFRLSRGFTVAQVAEKDGMVSYAYHPGPHRPSASVQELFLQCRKKVYWALPAGM
jgi:hypothetical protein